MIGYCYANERQALFTDEGQRRFLKMRDYVQALLKESGAFTCGKACSGITGDTWFMLACLDRMVELGEIRKACEHGMSQDHVYALPLEYRGH